MPGNRKKNKKSAPNRVLCRRVHGRYNGMTERCRVFWQIDETEGKRRFCVLFRGSERKRMRDFFFDDIGPFVEEIKRRGFDPSSARCVEDLYDTAAEIASDELTKSENLMTEFEEERTDLYDHNPFLGFLGMTLAGDLGGYYLLELARLYNNPSAYEEILEKIFPEVNSLRGTFSRRESLDEEDPPGGAE